MYVDVYNSILFIFTFAWQIKVICCDHLLRMVECFAQMLSPFFTTVGVNPIIVDDVVNKNYCFECDITALLALFC